MSTPSATLQEVISANGKYAAEFGDKEKLAWTRGLTRQSMLDLPRAMLT
jgi:hypothetical protein